MQEIEATVGDYLVDVPNFRTDDKDYLLRQIYTMTEKRFKLVKKWIAEKDWDFFMFVEMGQTVFTMAYGNIMIPPITSTRCMRHLTRAFITIIAILMVR